METLPIKRRDISTMCSKQVEDRENSLLYIAVMRKCGCSEDKEQLSLYLAFSGGLMYSCPPI